MRRPLGVSLVLLTLWPALASAQYDYNDDFTKAVAAHYPPLVRLLITKGAKQNTQNAIGDTPLMQAIRSRDREMTQLLMRYQPDYSLQNKAHHSAALEAVLADDPDSLSVSLARDDMLQVAQAAAVARKLNKRRAYNKLAEILGAAGADQLSSSALTDIRPYIAVGNTVSIAYSPPANVPNLCGKPSTVFLFQGKVCSVEGTELSVEWQSVSNLDNDDVSCSPQRHFRLDRSPNAQRNLTYLGACGVAPGAFSSLPATYDYRKFIIPELR